MDKFRHFHIQEETPFFVFKEVVAKEFGVLVQFQRFWFWGKRQNHTYRSDRPLMPQEEAQSVFNIYFASSSAIIWQTLLYLIILKDLRPNPLPVKTTKDLLIFFKLYDPEIEELRYVDRLFVKNSSKPIKILEKLNQWRALHLMKKLHYTRFVSIK